MDRIWLRNILYFLRQFGFDPVKTANSFKHSPKYLFSAYKFRRENKNKKFLFLPTLNDVTALAGTADGHYFWQDMICSKWIYKDAPVKHLDVGSRVDGFISSLLVFRSVTLVDIRPLDTKIDDLKYISADIQIGLPELSRTFESVSSLHCIEHFGLGRYGDKLKADGHAVGLINISNLVSEDGVLYVSFPIGEESIEFNSQRIIDPLWPEKILEDFELKEFILIPWKGEPKYGFKPSDVNKKIWGQAGLYKFKRTSHS